MDRVASAILGAFVLVAAIAFGLFFVHARADRHTISVTGAATQRFESDVVKWSITLSRQVSDDQLSTGYGLLRTDLQRVRDGLARAGLPDSAVGVQPVNANPTWDQYGNRTGYNLQQGVYVIAEGGGKELEALALDPGSLIQGGMVLSQSQLEYFYSKIDDLKHSLLAQATKDAQRRAEEIAGGSGLSVGKITNASAGVFQITEPYSTEIASYGVHDTSTRTKEITVTVHATFTVD